MRTQQENRGMGGVILCLVLVVVMMACLLLFGFTRSKRHRIRGSTGDSDDMYYSPKAPKHNRSSKSLFKQQKQRDLMEPLSPLFDDASQLVSRS